MPEVVMTRLLGLLILPVGTLSLLSAAPAPKTASVYSPLRVGAKQVYLHSKRAPQKDFDWTWTVDAVEADGPTSRVKLKGVVGEIRGYSKTMLVMKEGLFLADVNGTEYDPPLCLLKCPPTVGDAWSWSGDYGTFAKRTLKMKVTNIGSVTVPAGTFDAVRVEVTEIYPRPEGDHEVKYTEWFAPRVGPIKQVYSSGNNLMELKSFNPGVGVAPTPSDR